MSTLLILAVALVFDAAMLGAWIVLTTKKGDRP
jgi:hypothetical protein